MQPTITRREDYTVPDFLIEKVNLEFNLGEDITQVTAILNIKRNPLAAKKTKNLILQGDALTLQTVALNENTLSSSQYEATPNSLIIHEVPEHFSLKIITLLKPQENTALSGLYKSSGNFCTQCEAEGFRRITYFLDRPDVMAVYTTKIIADEKKYPVLLSNGNPVASGKLSEGKHWIEWQDPFKKPSYLFALVAGDLDVLEDFFVTCSSRKITLRIYVEKGNRDKCFFAMQAIKKAMAWDEKVYGREYDLDIYMIVAVSDFNMGAMENKGLNIFNTKYILAAPETATDQDFIHVESVIAHEYFHNWSGNRVTCRDWFQLSLKEGLTIFRDQSFTADTTSKTVARIHDVNYLRNAQFPEDAGPLSHPVRPESYMEINNFYTATVYNKGAEVIRMQKTLLGDKNFYAGMDLYFKKHDGQAVTIEDFVKSMEEASGIDLQQFRLWYSQAGTPVLSVTDNYSPEKKEYMLTIKQQGVKKPMHIPIRVGLLGQQGHELASELLELKTAEHTFTFKNITEKPVPSLLRGFSAPVKIKYDYSDKDFQLLFSHDADEFNRWEAGQKYAISILLRLINDYQQGKDLILPSGFIETYAYVLKNYQQDKLFLAELISLPSEKYIAEQMAVIDVDAIHAVREFVIEKIAKELQPLLLDIYQKNNDVNQSYQFTMQEVGKRELCNRCLFYLSKNQEEIHKLCLPQFKNALGKNMTDTWGALTALINIDCRERELALAEFYSTFKEDALVMDKWLAVQAASALPNTLAHVKTLMQHPAFDIKNPNKVYALIGAFGSNLVCFHAASGEGYQFLVEVVKKLDALNPSVSARMVRPLISWKRYDKNRQILMQKALASLAEQKNISKDLYEIVSKSLV